MDIYSIYKATNLINGKSYIGYTNELARRLKQHKQDSKNPKTYFHRAIKKHGWNNFQWDIIYQSKERNHTLNEMEKYFIEEYNTFNNGYNSTTGGECGIVSYESRQKIKTNKTGDHYIIIDPNGKEYETFDLPLFCKEYNIPHKSFYRVVNNNPFRKHYKGWTGYTLSEEQIKINEERNKIIINNRYKNRKKKYNIEWCIIDPDGNKHITNSLEKWCKDNIDPIKYRSIARMLGSIASGERNSILNGKKWDITRIKISV
jgi:predicted GIY-YIG superfamily endonuclease